MGVRIETAVVVQDDDGDSITVEWNDGNGWSLEPSRSAAVFASTEELKQFAHSLLTLVERHEQQAAEEQTP